MNNESFPWVFGLDTFGDLAYDADGAPLSHAETIRRVVDEAVLAEDGGRRVLRHR